LIENKYKHSIYSFLIMSDVVENKTVIKHLVISGGGTFGLSAYGLLKRLNEEGVWHIDNIVSIYGTSVGAILGATLALRYDWSIIDNYIINRPWNDTFKVNMNVLLQSFEKRGIYDITNFVELIEPLLRAVDISIDITMHEFFERTKIDLHIIVTELYELALVDISHTTHPDWRLIDAIYASACLPVLFRPLLKDSKCYIDGGFLCNYPLLPCIDAIAPDANTDEILGIRKKSTGVNETLDENSNLSEYLIYTFFRLIHREKERNVSIKNEIVLHCEITSLYKIYQFSVSPIERERFIREGYDAEIHPIDLTI